MILVEGFCLTFSDYLDTRRYGVVPVLSDPDMKRIESCMNSIEFLLVLTPSPEKTGMTSRHHLTSMSEPLAKPSSRERSEQVSNELLGAIAL